MLSPVFFKQLVVTTQNGISLKHTKCLLFCMVTFFKAFVLQPDDDSVVGRNLQLCCNKMNSCATRQARVLICM